MSERRSAPTARLESLSGDVSRLFIGGPLPAGWAGRLALGLSQRQITILRGCACRVSAGSWSAYFDLHGLTGAPALRATDYCALATDAETLIAPIAIELESYSLVSMMGGGLQLSVRGRDCVGFLGNLLDRLAGLSLFPEEMQIETHGRGAEDRFQICAPEGRGVSDEARRSLETLLSLWVRPSPPPRRSWR